MNAQSVSSVDVIQLSIPAKSEFVGVVRLAIAGVAGRMAFTVEQIEDIKIAVSEAVTNCVQYAYPESGSPGRIDVRCEISHTEITIVIQDYGCGFDMTILDDPEDRKLNSKMGLGLGITFVRSLMDAASVVSDVGKGTLVTMSKRCGS